MSLPTTLRKFRSDEHGGFAVWTALTITALFGVAALGIDMNYMYTTKAQLQNTADAAAMAAVKLLPDEDAALTAALNFTELNMPASHHGSVVKASEVEFGTWDKETRTFSIGGVLVNAVRVIAQRSAANNNAAPTFFASVLGNGATDISVDAIALQKIVNPCILALHPSSDKAVEVNSNGQISAQDCDIHVRSVSSSALFTDGNAQMAVTDGTICVEGDYVSQSNSNIDPNPETGCGDTSDDPMAGLSEPLFNGICDHESYVVDNGTVTLNPGIYCDGLIIMNNSNVTLSPGIYHIRDSEFLVDSNSNLSGTGVLIYLANGAFLNLNSNTTVDLTAPSSGDYTGVVIYAEPGWDLTHVVDSNNSSNFGGLIYLPGDKFVANSNTQVANGQSFTYLIAKTFYIDSNAHLYVDPESAAPVPPNLLTKLRAILVN